MYTLNALFVMLLLYLEIGANKSTPHPNPLPQERERGSSPPLPEGEGWGVRGVLSLPNTNSINHLWLIAFIAGLSLTHHRTMLLLMPALVLYLYIVYGHQFFQWRLLLPALLLGLLPLLLYLYLPLRGHIGSLDGSYENSWAGFWRQISGGGYGTFLFDNPFGHERDATFYWTLFSAQFYTLLFGLLGLIYLGQRHVSGLILTGLAFIIYLAFNLSYQVTDIEVFFIPNFIIWAIWSGLGVAFILRLITRLKSGWAQYVLTIFGLLLVGFTIYRQVQSNWRVIGEHYSWQVHDYGLDMLRQSLPVETAGGTTIIGIVGEMTLLRYFQQTEGLRADIETIAADREATRLAAVTEALAAGRNVYLTRELPGASERWSLNAVGPLIRVKPEPVTTAPKPAIPWVQEVTPEIALLGYEVSRPSHTGTGMAPVRLTLYWRAIRPILTELKVSARLVSPTGELPAVVDVSPVHFAYPTTMWRPGEVVSDVYDLPLPPDTPPGQYQPLIIWYDPAQEAAEVGRVALDPVLIE